MRVKVRIRVLVNVSGHVSVSLNVRKRVRVKVRVKISVRVHDILGLLDSGIATQRDAPILTLSIVFKYLKCSNHHHTTSFTHSV